MLSLATYGRLKKLHEAISSQAEYAHDYHPVTNLLPDQTIENIETLVKVLTEVKRHIVGAPLSVILAQDETVWVWSSEAGEAGRRQEFVVGHDSFISADCYEAGGFSRDAYVLVRWGSSSPIPGRWFKFEFCQYMDRDEPLLSVVPERDAIEALLREGMEIPKDLVSIYGGTTFVPVASDAQEEQVNLHPAYNDQLRRLSALGATLREFDPKEDYFTPYLERLEEEGWPDLVTMDVGDDDVGYVADRIRENAKLSGLNVWVKFRASQSKKDNTVSVQWQWTDEGKKQLARMKSMPARSEEVSVDKYYADTGGSDFLDEEVPF